MSAMSSHSTMTEAEDARILEQLSGAIIRAFPKLAGSTFRLLAPG